MLVLLFSKVRNPYVWLLVFLRLLISNYEIVGLRLGVKNSHIWELVSYVWELVIFTFGGSFSYVYGLEILTFGG